MQLLQLILFYFFAWNRSGIEFPQQNDTGISNIYIDSIMALETVFL